MQYILCLNYIFYVLYRLIKFVSFISILILHPIFFNMFFALLRVPELKSGALDHSSKRIHLVAYLAA